VVRIIVSGCAGRMGRRIASLVTQEEEMELVGGLERADNPLIGEDIGILIGLGRELGISLSADLSSILNEGDVVVEFTNPIATLEHLRIIAESGGKAVIGTTGFSTSQLEEIKKSSSQIPILLAPNMSVGMNLLFKLMEEAAEVLKEYEVEIVEAHHHNKVDAPSGTAKRLAEVIARTRGLEAEQISVYGRCGMIGKRKREEIGILSIRAGDIIGEHTVMFAAEGERVEFVHRVHSRDTFARGAIKAAKFIEGATPGLYSMGDVLGI
jgi:4-hydroxy-tetrahydrodipicolinate reductase